MMVQTKGPVQVARGTVLSVRLRIEGLTIDECEDIILWEGEVGNATFPVRVPKEAQHGPRQGVAAVYANGLRIARIDFVFHVASRLADAQSLSVSESRHQTAFASYASKDREEVAARIQGIQKGAPGIDIFWDRHSLRSGQQWEATIRQEIPARDVFYLFWSLAASRSPWVDKEWHCALETRGIDYIDPVPLVPPEDVPPPPELGGALHFNDWILAYTRYAPQTRRGLWWRRWFRRERNNS
jgi:hypothetical protein